MKNLLRITAILAIITLVVVVGVKGVSEMTVSADTKFEMPQDNVVEVVGEASVQVNPDVAYVNLGVTTKDVDSKKAQSDNKRLMNNVIDALVKEGIAKKDIVTANYNIYQTQEDINRTEDKSEQQVLFVVNNTVNIKMTELDKVGSIVDVASAAGANQIHNIRFDIDDRQASYNEALKLAMKDARSKATTIMTTFGDAPTKPLRVNEISNSGYVSNNRLYDSVMDANSATTITAGQLSVNAKVLVTYGY